MTAHCENNAGDLQTKLEQAVWIARSLYDRGKTSGSSANMSFAHDGELYISASGTCFGNLREDQFSRVGLDAPTGHLGGPKPSKELPLHRAFYEKKPHIGAVIHTHSTYATLWSCLISPDDDDVIPAYTPYLGMKLGAVSAVAYAPPGSKELFSLFDARMGKNNGYLLKNHGPVVGAASLMDAYFALEELEESARLAWMMRTEPNRASLLIPPTR